MALAELAFASKESSLSVRSFDIHDVMSGLFEVSVVARSPNGDIDLASIVGKAASLHLARGGQALGGAGRRWSGVCSRMEQTGAEAAGLSTYSLCIVPTLWLLTQRRNQRIFQHLSLPAIVEQVLSEWGIPVSLRIDKAQYMTLEYRVQYDETDFAFVSRLLEEAGIAYVFEDDGESSRLVLVDQPQAAEHRAGGSLAYVDNPSGEQLQDHVTAVVLRHDVRPGKYTIRDFDFRGRPAHPYFGISSDGAAEEVSYEQYHYLPGAFIDDKDGARTSERAANEVADIGLQALRSSRRQVTFQSNVLDLSPGVVFSMSGHTNTELEEKRRLLVVEATFKGTDTGEWSIGGRAVSADQPHRPPRHTPKPRIFGVQSAIVVGPKGTEIHTDKFGRVRVQFHWDRGGKQDDQSSCWVRVSQGWAGGGYGFITIPRIGHEVLVGFFEGDPDQPVVMGRVFNGEATVPYGLPGSQTVSTWKSSSSPASGGFNEIKFEDAQGQELVYVQAEKNLDKLVKNDETIEVRHDRLAKVKHVDSALVGERHSITIEQDPNQQHSVAPTSATMIDQTITFTTGDASITLQGPNITLEAKGIITIRSADGDVIIRGGPFVKINT